MAQKTVKLVVTFGQYEPSSRMVTVHYTTDRGLMRRARQLSDEYSVFASDIGVWIPARVAIASTEDKWEGNLFGVWWCNTANEWLV